MSAPTQSHRAPAITDRIDVVQRAFATYIVERDSRTRAGVSPGILRAFDANDITKELWNNQLNPRDGGGNYAKFAAPTIANGHVYLPTFSNHVVVYGLR